jgi:hypothetical protein
MAFIMMWTWVTTPLPEDDLRKLEVKMAELAKQNNTMSVSQLPKQKP